MQIQELLTPQRIAVSLPVTSKKRLLEQLGEILGRDGDGVDGAAAFHCLIERERLGSTGIGDGVALPHGRVTGLTRAIGALVTLEPAMDFDAIDGKPVKLVFALLVPESATTEHLQLLARIATLFRDANTRHQLIEAKSPEELYSRLTASEALTTRSA